MVRSKRKRTREEIEEALRENERVNAAPVGPEDPEDKRRRKARRRQNDSRLNKARRELNLTDRCHTIDGMLPSERVVVDTEESKEDSGNQENSFIRPEVSADQLGGSAQPATTGVALPTADEVREAAKRARRERDRIRRSNRTLSQKERDRRKQAEYQRARRARQREARAQAEREWVEAFQASRQASQTEEERIAEREIARLQEEIQRLQMGDEQLATERERDRLYQEERRAAQTDEEKDKEKERGRIRRKCTRRGHALANHEHFHKSQVSGEDIEEGRHQLPGQFTCIWCGAWKWPGESDVSCCLKGRVQLSPLLPAPGELQQLYRTAEFRENIRAYNQVFAFTSVGASRSDTGGFGREREDESVQGQRGVYTYRIQGAMGHYLGSLLPHYDFSTGELAPAKFAQIYFVDPNMQRRALRRESIFAHLSPVTLLALETMIEAINPLAQQFISFGKQLRKAVREGKEVLDIVFKLHADPRSPGTTTSLSRQSLLRLFETNSMYDPLQYPLLFPNGELGWTYRDTYANGQLYRKTAKMSLREFVAYRLFPKLGDGSVLHHGGRLFQQWCVDQRAKVEQDSLRWIANNQKLIRADLYKGVADAYLNEHTDALRENEVRLGEFNRASDDQPPRNGRNDHFLNQYGLRRITRELTLAARAICTLATKTRCRS
ncbi:hypothetical protein F442_08609 [Phytophthora nicotianae P10297]|uniref:Helitron helicase-like domain-containing protein n=1 Tax=Phytophthora nicotianae P10297 TaxID=1317064 RepID=W2ZFA9_PHYNI|nr:hypothetical protein F442_08609 [Phytophthora nicotianae P10297]